MANGAIARPRVQTITTSEISALADRLEARSRSRLFDSTPEVRNDIRLAAQTLRALLRFVHASDIIAL
jgi:hypothetical protein